MSDLFTIAINCHRQPREDCHYKCMLFPLLRKCWDLFVRPGATFHSVGKSVTTSSFPINSMPRKDLLTLFSSTLLMPSKEIEYGNQYLIFSVGGFCANSRLQTKERRIGRRKVGKAINYHSRVDDLLPFGRKDTASKKGCIPSPISLPLQVNNRATFALICNIIVR